MLRTIVLAACSLALAAAPARIISTTPSATEILFALGVGDRIVGVTTYCRYPEAARSKPKVGTFMQVDLEAIAAGRPDLVVVLKSPVGPKSKIEGMGLRTVEIEHNDLAGLYGAIKVIGAATGVPERATVLVQRIQRELDGIRRRTAARAKIPVLFVVGRTPATLEGIVTIGKKSHLSEIVDVAGGRNVFADSTFPYFKVSLEEILSRNPAVIVDMGDMADAASITPAHTAALRRLWSQYPKLRAVASGAVHAIPPDIFAVPGPRVADAARTLARILNPAGGF